MQRLEPAPRKLSDLEVLVSKLPDNVIPNFERVNGILFDTFVRPDGPALLLVSHYYYTGRGFSKEEPTQDPTEQMRWCRQNLAYFSPAAKFIARLRNKLAHKDYVDPTLLKSLARELSILEFKGSNGGYLLKTIISKLKKALKICLGDPKDTICKECGRSYAEESPEKIPKIVPIIDPDFTTLKDVKLDPSLRESIKGKTVMIIGGLWNNKLAIFRSWSGTTVYMDIQDIGRKNVRLTTTIKFLD